MTEITDEPTRRRGWLDRLAIGILIGATAISVGAIALLTVYLNRITDAASAIHRVDSLGAYEGRPAPVEVNGVTARNFLLTTTTADGDLDAVLVAHLSASRQNLTLIAFPADLEVSAGSLAATNARDPLLVVRELERLTGARMDHQVHVDVDRFADVVDALGGVELSNASLTGVEARASLAATPVQDRSLASAELLRATLIRASSSSAITDPTKFDRLMNALTPCLKVDDTLTADAIQATFVESRVHADEIAITQLAVARTGTAARADHRALAQLREAFATDDFDYAQAAMMIASEPSPEPTR